MDSNEDGRKCSITISNLDEDQKGNFDYITFYHINEYCYLLLKDHKINEDFKLPKYEIIIKINYFFFDVLLFEAVFFGEMELGVS